MTIIHNNVASINSNYNSSNNNNDTIIVQHPWKYVYFTEPDLISHANFHQSSTYSVLMIQNILQTGHIMMSHRLHLIQHEHHKPIEYL